MSDEEEKEGVSFSIGGYPISGWMVAVALPVLSAVGGGAWYIFDLQSRFLGVEESVSSILDVEARVQTLEQAAADGDLRGLSSRLSELSTQMNTILENQRQLLDLRQRVDQATVVTDNLSQDLNRYNVEIEDLWRAVDALNQPLR
jgi:chromosome segregation ATPase